jgi:cation diffusion facilitator family transporter
MAQKFGAAALSVGVNVALLATKAGAAYVTGSMGLLAESAHSLFDLFASVLAYIGIKKADEPSDEMHHYGHYKYENLSSLLQGLLITATAAIIMYEAWQKIGSPGNVEFSEVGIALMLLSIPVTLYTSKYLGRIAAKEGSSALEADSAHFTTDVISSVSVLVGLLLVKLGFPAGDPLSAIVVSLVMFYISVEILWKSIVVFMDFAPDKETVGMIRHVLDNEKRITRYHKLRARMAGSRVLVDVHIHMPPNTPIKSAHTVAHEITDTIKRKVSSVSEVNIHIEPD